MCGSGLRSRQPVRSVRAHYPGWNQLRFGPSKQLAPECLPYCLRPSNVLIGGRTWSGVGAGLRTIVFRALHLRTRLGWDEVVVGQQTLYHLSHTNVFD